MALCYVEEPMLPITSLPVINLLGLNNSFHFEMQLGHTLQIFLESADSSTPRMPELFLVKDLFHLLDLDFGTLFLFLFFLLNISLPASVSSAQYLSPGRPICRFC